MCTVIILYQIKQKPTFNNRFVVNVKYLSYRAAQILAWSKLAMTISSKVLLGDTIIPCKIYVPCR